ncbi:hypothetical protein ABZ611_30955 [Streptomyces sp. NPDC007861]|uniref:hypothetical protein n=1 Tax=Streptomyces sp. NPDC007861 TaxID=3154893 RepID=UPI0033C89AF4
MSALLLCAAITAPSATAASTVSTPHQSTCSLVGSGDDAMLYCDTRGGAEVLDAYQGTQQLAGTMREGLHAFPCWEVGNQHEGGDIWYLGRLDDRPEGSNGGALGWGYVTSTDVLAPAHPFPGLRRCSG